MGLVMSSNNITPQSVGDAAITKISCDNQLRSIIQNGSFTQDHEDPGTQDPGSGKIWIFHLKILI